MERHWHRDNLGLFSRDLQATDFQMLLQAVIIGKSTSTTLADNLHLGKQPGLGTVGTLRGHESYVT